MVKKTFNGINIEEYCDNEIKRLELVKKQFNQYLEYVSNGFNFILYLNKNLNKKVKKINK